MGAQSIRSDYRADNRERLIAYFEGGATPADGASERVGVEIEHFIVREDGEPVYYRPHDGVIGVEDILDHLEQAYPQRIVNPRGDLLGLANETGSITLEPAAQLEFSIAPYARIEQAEAAYRSFRGHLDPFLAQHGCTVAAAGYHPSAKALDLPLIPKERYRLMDEHFANIGTHGERMMRASASTQVSIDYHSEADAVRKMRVATALVPLLAFITDNAPVFEGAPDPAPLCRLNLWRDVDPARCGTVPGVFDEDFGFARYADWLLGTSPIFITRPAADDPEGPGLRVYEDTPASQAYADAPMDKRDIEHLASMFWPDVRLKRFVEIRPADSLPAAEVLGYAALVKGIFYTEANLAALERALGVRGGRWPLDERDIDAAIGAVRQSGGSARVFGGLVASWVDLLFELAAGGLDAEEAAYLAALRTRNARADSASWE